MPDIDTNMYEPLAPEDVEFTDPAGEIDRPKLMLPAAPHAGGGPSLKLRFMRSSIKFPVVVAGAALGVEEDCGLSGSPKSTKSINDVSFCGVIDDVCWVP